jgi:hypothetical protein
MYDAEIVLMSFIKKIAFGWNLFWWNYHVERAREHDRRNSRIKPRWRDFI